MSPRRTSSSIRPSSKTRLLRRLLALPGAPRSRLRRPGQEERCQPLPRIEEAHSSSNGSLQLIARPVSSKARSLRRTSRVPSKGKGHGTQQDCVNSIWQVHRNAPSTGKRAQTHVGATVAIGRDVRPRARREHRSVGCARPRLSCLPTIRVVALSPPNAPASSNPCTCVVHIAVIRPGRHRDEPDPRSPVGRTPD